MDEIIRLAFEFNAAEGIAETDKTKKALQELGIAAEVSSTELEDAQQKIKVSLKGTHKEIKANFDKLSKELEAETKKLTGLQKQLYENSVKQLNEYNAKQREAAAGAVRETRMVLQDITAATLADVKALYEKAGKITDAEIDKLYKNNIRKFQQGGKLTREQVSRDTSLIQQEINSGISSIRNNLVTVQGALSANGEFTKQVVIQVQKHTAAVKDEAVAVKDAAGAIKKESGAIKENTAAKAEGVAAAGDVAKAEEVVKAATEEETVATKASTDTAKASIATNKARRDAIEQVARQIKAQILAFQQLALSEQEQKAIQSEMYPPTERQIAQMENLTRQTILATESLQRQQDAAQNTLKKFADAAPRLSKFSLYVAGGFVASMYEGIKQWGNFQKIMTTTFTQAHVATSKQKALTADVLDVAKQTGKSYNDVADALYRVASATSSWNNGTGATTGQLNALLKTTAQLQVLGNVPGGAQSEAAARIIGAVAMSDMKDITGKNDMQKSQASAAMINAIVGAGDIKMTDLISALGRGVLTSAKSVGLGMKDVGAFIDLMTVHGTTGATAGTYVAHALQLLTGSTQQNRQYQAAIGIAPGDLEEIMKTKGLGATAQYLSQHMNSLNAISSLSVQAGTKHLTGQDAAVYMMQKAQLTPEQIQVFKSGQLANVNSAADYKNLTKEQQKVYDTVRLIQMQAMFGGGRQAIPLITLMENLGQYNSINSLIGKSSTQKEYKKDLAKAMDQPAVQQAKLLRSLQYDLMMFGKTMSGFYSNLLRWANDIMSFANKFKTVFAAVIAGLLATVGSVVGFRLGAKAVLAGRNTLDSIAYHAKKIGLAGGKESIQYGKWSNRYANERKLAYGSDYKRREEEIKLGIAFYTKGLEWLEMVGSGATKESLLRYSGVKGYGLGKEGDVIFKMRETLHRKPYSMTEEEYIESLKAKRAKDFIRKVGDAEAEHKAKIKAAAEAALYRPMIPLRELDKIERDSKKKAEKEYRKNPMHGLGTREERIAKIARRFEVQAINETSPLRIDKKSILELATEIAKSEQSLGRLSGMSPDKATNKVLKHIQETGYYPSSTKEDYFVGSTVAEERGRHDLGTLRGRAKGMFGKIKGAAMYDEAFSSTVRRPKINPDGSTDINIIERSAEGLATKSAGKISKVLTAVTGAAGMIPGWGMAIGAIAPIAVPILSKVLGNLFSSGPSVQQVVQSSVKTWSQTPVTNAQNLGKSYSKGANASVSGSQTNFANYMLLHGVADREAQIAEIAKTSPDTAVSISASDMQKQIGVYAKMVDIAPDGSTKFHLGNGKWVSSVNLNPYDKKNPMTLNATDFWGDTGKFSKTGKKVYGRLSVSQSSKAQAYMDALEQYSPDYAIRGQKPTQDVKKYLDLMGFQDINWTPKPGEAGQAFHSKFDTTQLANLIIGANGAPVLPSVNWGAKLFHGAFTTTANKDLGNLTGMQSQYTAAGMAGDTQGQVKVMGQMALDAAQEQKQATLMQQQADAQKAKHDMANADLSQRAANRLQQGADTLKQNAQQMWQGLSIDQQSQIQLAELIGQAVAQNIKDPNGGSAITQMLLGLKTTGSLGPTFSVGPSGGTNG